MDTIAGKEQVRSLTEKAEAAAAAIRTTTIAASGAYASFTQLEQQVARLKELRKGLKELRNQIWSSFGMNTKLLRSIGRH